MIPDFRRYCPDCDCPDICGGTSCLRDELGDDRGIAEFEMKEQEPLVVINQPQFDKEKEFLTEIIS